MRANLLHQFHSSFIFIVSSFPISDCHTLFSLFFSTSFTPIHSFPFLPSSLLSFFLVSLLTLFHPSCLPFFLSFAVSRFMPSFNSPPSFRAAAPKGPKTYDLTHMGNFLLLLLLLLLILLLLLLLPASRLKLQP